MRPFLPRLVPFILVLILAGPAAGSLHDRKSLTLEGRTIDPEGFPIEKVKVRVLGARHASVVSNVDGQFMVKIPIGTPDDLRRTPLRIAVEAEKKGYRFTVPAGDQRLGLDLGLEVASGGLARCVARSNDDRVAATAARIIALEGDAIGDVAVNFIGVKGTPDATASWPKLQNVAQAALGFPVEGPIHGLPPGSGAPDLGTKSRSAWSIVREGEPTKGADSARDQQAKKKAQALAESTAAGALGAARASAVGDSSMEKWRDARWQPSQSAIAPAPATTSATSASAPSASAPAPTSTHPSSKDARPSGPVVHESIVPLTAAEIASERERLDRTLPPAPTPAPASSAVKKPTITPEPSLQGRGRARPLVISNPPPGSRAHPDTCECHVEGTVEVQAVVPIRGPQKVEISYQWYPQLRDTVELFMGPPRPFKLPAAACGPQRLRVRILTDARFDIATREALEGFRCEGGHPYQPRLVLITR